MPMGANMIEPEWPVWLWIDWRSRTRVPGIKPNTVFSYLKKRRPMADDRGERHAIAEVRQELGTVGEGTG